MRPGKIPRAKIPAWMAVLTERDRLDELRHPALLALRGQRIGPIFPRDEAFGALQGMRGVPRTETHPPIADAFRARRRRRRHIASLSRSRNRR